MSMFAGFEPRRPRDFGRLAASAALAAATLAALPIATPVQSADLTYERYSERTYEYERYREPVPAYPPQVRYYEPRYEQQHYRVPAYPPQAGYGEPGYQYRHYGRPPAATPQVRYRGQPDYVQPYDPRTSEYAPRPHVPGRHADRRYEYGDLRETYAAPADPYGRVRFAEEPLLPPGLVGPPRAVIVEAPPPGYEWREATPRW